MLRATAGVWLFLVLLATPNAVRADDAPVLATSAMPAQTRLPFGRRPGPRVALTLGSRAAAIGGYVAYERPRVWRQLNVAPWITVSALRAAAGDKTPIGYVAGTEFSYGIRHRVMAGAGGGRVAAEDLYLHSIPVDARALWGVMGEVGYEFLGDWGFFFRLVLLRGTAVMGGLTEPEHRFLLDAEFALGWKML